MHRIRSEIGSDHGLSRYILGRSRAERSCFLKSKNDFLSFSSGPSKLEGLDGFSLIICTGFPHRQSLPSQLWIGVCRRIQDVLADKLRQSVFRIPPFLMESLSFTGYEPHFPILAGDLVLNQCGVLSLFLEEALVLL